MNVNDLSAVSIRDAIETLDGEILTQPSLVRTDGASLTYACDVKLVHQEGILRAVPIALGSSEIEYADVGSAVTLARAFGSGRFEIVGYSKRKPGSRTLIPVDLSAITADAPVDDTLSSRRLTLEEIGDPSFAGGFGVCPFGAVGIFRGATLLEVKA